MTDVAAAHARTKNALSRALDEGMLSGQTFESASRLISDLRSPMRVALFGLPRSGKSSVLNLLLGQEVIPDGLDLPTLSVRRGPKPLARLTMTDGRVTDHPNYDLTELAGLDAVFFELQLNLPALAKISILELAMGQTIKGQGRAIAWGAKQCDLALWCTRGFPEHEASLWQAAPEQLKDRSILLRTRLDEVGSRAAREDEVHRLEQVAGDEFTRVLGLSAAEAAAATGPDGVVDKAALRASGGMTVISSVLRHLEVIQQPLIDQADVLLVKAGLADVPGYGAEDEPPEPEDDDDGDRGPWLLMDGQSETPEAIAPAPEPAPRPVAMPVPDAEPAATPEPGTTRRGSPLFRPKPKPEADPVRETAALDSVSEDALDALHGDPAAPAPDPVAADPAPSPAPAAETSGGVEAAIGAMVKTAGPLVLTAPVAVPAGTPPPATSPRPAVAAAAASPAPIAPEPVLPEPANADPAPVAEEPAALTLVPDAAAPILLSEDLRKNLSGAVRRLRTAGASMMNLEPDEILENSVETIEWLSERFDDDSMDLPAPLEAIKGQVDEAFDLVQLLQLETADSASVDAVAVLLQLKRGIEAQLAH